MSSTACRLRLFGVEPESIVDGPGIRFSIFVQGCPHGCPGCHNPGSHDFAGGYDGNTDELFEAIRTNPYLTGVTFSGGEPFCQAAPLAALAERIHRELGKTVMVYTGYTLEKLEEMAQTREDIAALLNQADTLVDGPFILAERDLSLLFRGSRNQRIIDMKEYRAKKA
ncbi:MAG TPA: anaerobic ribonucleoside-triphosphate reductase activating protein [Ruminococcaceae bacterium]|nr:anaerobic ribonucleoside-triphosphate reductase activating protein [Oscillospiraceae bacterium]